MKITHKQSLVDLPEEKVTLYKIHAPDIAAKAKPGEFIVLMVEKTGERIPLTIVKADPDAGEITLIVQIAGFTTNLLNQKNVGDSLYALLGPLGHPTEIKEYGKVILVGGGVGIAVLYPVAKALKDAGNQVTTILGARTKDLLILEDECRATSDALIIATDDGSYGIKGFTTDNLRACLEKEKANLVYAVGPIPMMRAVARVTEEFHVKTIVSLNALMVDGTGMCGGCRVPMKETSAFTCVDGPEFDAHVVDWDVFDKRTKTYKKEEGHICRLKKI